MRSLILCAEPGPGKNTDIRPEILENADFGSDGELPEDQIYDVVWAQECSLDLLFTREGKLQDDFWMSVWNHLRPEGVFAVKGLRKYIGVTLQVQDFSDIIRAASKWFFLVGFADDTHAFRKILDNADVTTIEELNDAMRMGQPLADLFNMDPEKEMCSIANKFGVKLGEGAQGDVFYHPEWRTDVAIKRIRTQKRIIAGATKPFIRNPKQGVYSVTDGFLEMLSSSLIAELSDGTSDKGYSLHVPRFTGFFTCPGEMPGLGTVYDLYIITELMQTDLKKELKFTGDRQIMKSLVWQALYTLISINAIGWQHHDASPRNFLVSDVQPNEIFLNREIGKASRWVYRLNGKSWSLKNFRKVVKVADFGFLVHLEAPEIHYSDELLPEFRVTNKLKRGADVNYFMITIMRQLDDSFKPLFEDWWRLIKGPHVESLYATLLRTANAGSPHTSQMAEVFTEFLRSTEKYDDWDTVELLSSPFFSDIVE